MPAVQLENEQDQDLDISLDTALRKNLWCWLDIHQQSAKFLIVFGFQDSTKQRTQ